MTGATPADMDADRHDVEVTVRSFSEPLPEVDWDNLQIVETHDDEGRIELMTEDQVYVLLGLRDEETAKLAAPNGRRMDDQGGDNDGSAIHVSDAIPDEMVITYDKDHPKMDLGTMYPSMKDFRMAVRQFAINEEFDLGTEKSDKTRFRGFCKSSEDCPWRIVQIWNKRLINCYNTYVCSRLAFLLGEGSSSQTSTTTPKRMPPVAAPKKMTPKRK